MECCSQKKDDALLPAQPAPPKKSQEDKENIDPCPLQQHSSGLSSMFAAPASKQQLARNCSSSSAKGRAPLADITALCMLQASMPPKQQHGTGLGPVVQKGLWGQANHVDKIGAGSTSGSGMAPGHRLAAMR